MMIHPSPFIRTTCAVGALLGCLAAYGCDGGTTQPTTQVASVQLTRGENQVRFPGTALASPIQVMAVDQAGKRIEAAGIPVVWHVQSGGGTVQGDGVTDGRGTAMAQWVLGSGLGEQTLSVRMAQAPALTLTARAVEPGPITFVHPEGGIYVANPDGSNSAPIVAGEGRWPNWNPNGSSIIYGRAVSDGTTQLFSTSAPNWKETQLTHRPAPDSRGLLYMYPKFSPDGTKIVYHLKTSHPDCRGATWTQVFVANADGTQPVQLTDGCNMANGRPRFSPSGDRIAFQSLRNESWSYTDMRFSIWVIGADGSNQVRITDLGTTETDPVWAPDGSRIYFVKQGAEIWSVRPDGADARRLLTPPFRPFSLQDVSPDGEWLLLDTYDSLGGSDVVTVSLSTGTVKVLARGGRDSSWRQSSRGSSSR